MPKAPRIAVDAMGGDFGPRINVPAAVTAAERGAEIILVGDEGAIQHELQAVGATQAKNISIVHATQVVGMDEKPAESLRAKKDSSIQVACRLVKDGTADGLVSAGNSGATVACGMFVLGRIQGVERPALAGIIPTEKKPMVLVDVGANVDSKPSHLAQYAVMGEVLARSVLKIEDPSVALLSIGEEEGKGNVVTKETFELLRDSSLRFVGNAEGRDIFTGEINVVVCDGFVGNVALKVAEGVAKSFGHILKGELKRDVLSKMGTLMLLPTLTRFARTLDYAEYGGAPLLGLKGPVMVCHGASTVKAVVSAVAMCATYVTMHTGKQLIAELEANPQLSKLSRKPAKN